MLKDDEQVRLPTEPEWERTAAYPLSVPTDDSRVGRRAYPWGEWPSGESAIPTNTSESGIRGTSVAGIFPQGTAACGAEDMASNVWEWCSTAYQPYPLPEEVVPETLDTNSRGRTYVLHGGSWYNNQSLARCAYRHHLLPVYAFDDVGLRLARLFSSGSS